MLENDIVWDNFVENIKMYLKPNGYMLITCFDAARILKIFENTNKYSSYYTNNKGEKKLFFELLKQYGDVDSKKIIGTGHAIDVHVSVMFQEGEYQTEYLVDKRFLEKELLEKCDMELVETDLFDNQFNIHRNYFKHAVQYEDNPQTKKFLENVAMYYDHTDEVNRACYKLSRMYRYYVFRRRDTAKIGGKRKLKKQMGGKEEKDYSFDVVPEHLDPSKYVRKDIHHKEDFSFLYSVCDVLQPSDIIPKSVDVSTLCEDIDYDMLEDDTITNTDISRLCKNLVIGHDVDGKKVSKLNNVNIIIISDNGITSHGKHKTLYRKHPSIILYKKNDVYQPVYRRRKKNSNLLITHTYNGLIDTRLDYMKNIIIQSEGKLYRSRKKK